MEWLCPNCGTETLTRYKTPRTVGNLVFRRHRCSTCLMIVTSVQMLLTSEAQMEEALELSIRQSRTSDPMRSAGDGQTLGTLALGDSLTI